MGFRDVFSENMIGCYIVALIVESDSEPGNKRQYLTMLRHYHFE